MKRYLILALFAVSCCSEHDAIVPVSHESELAKYDKYHDSKNSYSRHQNYEKSESSLKDDLTIIDEDYNKYISGKKNIKGYGSEDYQQRQRKYSNEELDQIFGYTGPTANDEPDNLMRPCALDDLECIRRFFASNGKCKPAYGPVPDPLYQDVYTAFFSSANITTAFPNVQVRGLSSAKIIEFYVNKKTGNLVFAIVLRNFTGFDERLYFRYRRTAKESIILAGVGSFELGPATFTAVIPKVPDLRLDLADCHVDVQTGQPQIFLSPELAASPDPDVLTSFAALLGRFPLSIREGLLFESQLLIAIYIQTNICDFGLKLISV